ncbi:MAG: prepilin-type N-terminal cleavage/methylation domain-containing protein [Gemmataceae bacterium]|nr:prepilin-type N-terminal cleavage/methylation domain-containing protein [Gemmataceae bacterium]
MNRRGVTLTEVLVAIFVTGLGLMALMTLFPLGALNMAQAVKDDRSAAAAANASSYFRAWWRLQLANGTTAATMDNAMLKPAGLGDLTGTSGPSYPVYIDPIGVQGNVGNMSSWIAGSTSATPSRISGPWAPDATSARQFFTFLDDYNFGANGLPRGAFGAGEVERESRYSWAYMVRRLRANEPRVLEFSVVVYSGRSTLAPQTESIHDATFALPNIVTLTSKPQIRKGGWILDATMTSPPQGYFYRVVNVRDISGGVEIEVQTPFRRAAGAGKVAVLSNVAEVFDRSTLE